MTLDIKGEYIIKNKETNETLLKGSNMILDAGIVQLLRTFTSSGENHYIKTLSFGFGTETPSKADTDLTNAKNTTTNVSKDETNMQIILDGTISGDLVIGATEIGVYTDNKVLFTRDLLSESLSIPSGSTVAVTYTISFNASEHLLSWTEVGDGVYSTTCSVNPVSIKQIYNSDVYYFTKGTSSSLTEAKTFYYDETAKKLFCYPYDAQTTDLYLIEG